MPLAGCQLVVFKGACLKWPHAVAAKSKSSTRVRSFGIVSCQSEVQSSGSFSLPKGSASAWRLASYRVAEDKRPDRLFADPYSAQLFQEAPTVTATEEQDQRLSALVTRFIDDELCSFADISSPGVRQVVLFTEGLDTRPYRLPWRPGTFLFEVAPDDISQYAAAIFKQAKIRVPKGCSLRPVGMNLGDAPGSWPRLLERKGYRGDLPSVWAMQGLTEFGHEGLEALLQAIGDLAMSGSVLIGEVPVAALTPTNQELAFNEATNLASALFAKHGFLLEAFQHEVLEKRFNGGLAKRTEDRVAPEKSKFLLIRAVQQRLSIQQVNLVQENLEEFEEFLDGEEAFEDLF